eukprot:7683910-Pyramimonas_sp.AAC.1
MWQRNPHLHGRVCAAWGGIRDRLRRAGVRRWSSVRGPISVRIATLMDIGWEAVTATSWLRPTECDDDPVDQWDIPSAGDPGFTPTGSFQALLEDAEADI